MSDRNHRSFMEHPLAQLTLVRFREFWREPDAVFWTFVFPILLAAGLGFAFRYRPPEAAPIGVARSTAGADTVVAWLEKESRLRVKEYSREQGDSLLRTGDIALLVIPIGAGRVEYRFDNTREDARNARMIADDALQRGAGRQDPVTAEERLISEPGSRYIDFVVPGLLGMNLMGSSIWSLGFAIVTARNKKLLKRLVATPMSKAHYLLSFMFSRLFFLGFEVAALLVFARFVFGVPLRGPLTTLAAISVLSAMSFGGLGLLVASRAKTIEAASGIMNFVMLPMWIASGVFFSAKNFPAAVQPFVRALPLTAVNDALRANMLRGVSLSGLGSELLVIVLWMIISFGVALKLFRWR
jgi:ABC-2 type transport system permease protein